MGACVTRLGALLNLGSYQILESRELPSNTDPDMRPVVAVDVAVKDSRGSDAGESMGCQSCITVDNRGQPSA